MGKIVFTNGCFDMLHAGHLDLLEFANRLCDHEYGDDLIIAVNSDKSIGRIKGPLRPIIPEDERIRLLESLRFKARVLVFDEDTPWELMKRIRLSSIDIIVKGPDYYGREDAVVGSNFCQVRCLSPGTNSQQSTSRIIRKISNLHG